MDMPFITHITREYTDNHESVQKDRASPVWGSLLGVLDKGGTCPTVTLNYIISLCKRIKKQSQDKKPLPKGDKEGVTTHTPNNTHSWPVAI